MATEIRNTLAFGHDLRVVREQWLGTSSTSMDVLAGWGGPSASRQGEIENGADTEITTDLLAKYDTAFAKANSALFPTGWTGDFLRAFAGVHMFHAHIGLLASKLVNSRQLEALRAPVNPLASEHLVIGVTLDTSEPVYADVLALPFAKVPQQKSLGENSALTSPETYWGKRASVPPPGYDFPIAASRLAREHMALLLMQEGPDSRRATAEWSRHASDRKIYHNAESRIDPLEGVWNFRHALRRAEALGALSDHRFHLAWAILLANAIGLQDASPPFVAWIDTDSRRIDAELGRIAAKLPTKQAAEMPTGPQVVAVAEQYFPPYRIRHESDQWGDIEFTGSHEGIQWSGLPDEADDSDIPIVPQPGDLLLHGGPPSLAAVLDDQGHRVIQMNPDALVGYRSDHQYQVARWFPFPSDPDLALIHTEGASWQPIQMF